MSETMVAPIGAVIAASTAVKAKLGTAPVRFWEFADAPRGQDGNIAAPYAVWQTVYGSQQNYLNGSDDAEQWGLQIDVYAAASTDAREIAGLIRAALRPHATLVAYNGESKDVPTGLYRYSFTVEWITNA